MQRAKLDTLSFPGSIADIPGADQRSPVRVQFVGWDEHGWDTYGPAHIGECRIAADDGRQLTAYQYHGW